MYGWADDLFPICRSLSGAGVRETLSYFKGILPNLNVCSIASGTRVFDWTVPSEWNVKDAYIADEQGRRLVDFNQNNLHLVGYSQSIDRWMSFDELDAHFHSLPDQPEAIPYVTSYYSNYWGFCITERQRDVFRKSSRSKYYVKIDTSFTSGVLNFGELVLPGESEKEILLSTYVCHPSMANNELSGPVVVAGLALWLQNLKKRKYTYRIVFLVETIGAIAYLSQNLEQLKKNVMAGYVLTCVGDDRAVSFMPSRSADTLADRTALRVLKKKAPDYISYSFLQRGSDERQYCAPGVDLPVASIMRSKYGEYPEYHTSLDDLSLISPEGLEGAYNLYKTCLEYFEETPIYRNKVLCEPQLGKRGLYPSLSTKDTQSLVAFRLNVLTYLDGNKTADDIADILGEKVHVVRDEIELLNKHGLLERIV